MRQSRAIEELEPSGSSVFPEDHYASVNNSQHMEFFIESLDGFKGSARRQYAALLVGLVLILVISGAAVLVHELVPNRAEDAFNFIVLSLVVVLVALSFLVSVLAWLKNERSRSKSHDAFVTSLRSRGFVANRDDFDFPRTKASSERLMNVRTGEHSYWSVDSRHEKVTMDLMEDQYRYPEAR